MPKRMEPAPVDARGPHRLDVGYADPAVFSKLFQKLTGQPPAAYGQQFGIAGDAP